MLTLRQLTYLQAVGNARSFRQAAERSNISQPALSMQIRALEEELGVALVERTANGVRLTEAGREAHRRSTTILAAVQDLKTWASEHETKLKGELKLGVIPSIAPYVLPVVLPAIAARFPALRVQLRETQTDALVAALTAAELDLLLLALPVGRSELTERPLFDDPFLLAAPGAVARERCSRVDPSELDTLDLLLLEEGHCLREQALSYCRHIDGTRATTFGASSLATIMQMVANGYGVTLLPSIAAGLEARHEGVELLRFTDPQPFRTVGLAWRRSSSRAPEFERLAQLIGEVARPQS